MHFCGNWIHDIMFYAIVFISPIVTVISIMKHKITKMKRKCECDHTETKV